ncbi:MAG: hypothetical protein IJK23_10180 [Clostridia bacterium]|nr:hypothetical protein [Clostridia bacterium]
MDKSLTLHTMTGCAYEQEQCDAALAFAEEIILNFCNIDEVPAGLDRTHLGLAADLLRRKRYGKNGGETQTVKSVTVGDTSTTFGELSDEDVQGILANYRGSLVRYRRVAF